MTGVLVRPMTIADLDALLPFEAEMFGPEAWTRRSYQDELADTELRYYVVATDQASTVLGSAGLLTIADTAQIMTVGVLPAARRQGIARLLVADLVAHARQRQASEVLLEVRVDNDAAVKLYETAGFERMGVRRGYYDRGRVDALTMRLELAG